MPLITLAALNVYPIKSCPGIALERTQLTSTGLAHDREWMIVTPDGRFHTQRELPRLALIEPALSPHALRMTAPGFDTLEVPLDFRGAATEVLIWKDRCAAI